VKVRVRVKVKNGSRVEREDVLTQRRRDAEYAERFEPRNTLNTRKGLGRGEVEKGEWYNMRLDNIKQILAVGEYVAVERGPYDSN
jgi:hypothetical protein